MMATVPMQEDYIEAFINDFGFWIQYTKIITMVKNTLVLLLTNRDLKRYIR